MEMAFAKKLNRLERLKKVHRHLDKEIQKDYNRLQDVSAQKIEKLKLKDQISTTRERSRKRWEVTITIC